MSEAQRRRSRESYRRVHAVHPVRYRTAERRLFCRECWDELTPETAARHPNGSLAAWCAARCWAEHRREVWRSNWRARKARGWQRGAR